MGNGQKKDIKGLCWLNIEQKTNFHLWWWGHSWLTTSRAPMFSVSVSYRAETRLIAHACTSGAWVYTRYNTSQHAQLLNVEWRMMGYVMDIN